MEYPYQPEFMLGSPSAALIGLLFIAASLHVKEVVNNPVYYRRAFNKTCYLLIISEGFSHFVTSIATPVASGWSGCRVVLAPTGKRRLVTVHTHFGRSKLPGLLL
jgi:hypothetical protein